MNGALGVLFNNSNNADSVGINSYPVSSYDWRTDKVLSPNEKAGLGEGLDNLFTGNLDYQREMEMLKNNQAFNSSEAQKQREFEERMSSTSYQRAKEDLEKAGLNPALLYGMSGASTPSSSSASSSGGHSGKAGSGFLSLLNGLMTLTGFALKNNSDMARMNIEKSVAEANIERLKAMSKMNGANTAYLESLADLTTFQSLNERDYYFKRNRRLNGDSELLKTYRKLFK